MRRKGILLVLVVFQLLIVGVMVGQSMLPLYTGRPIEMRVEPRDPRDLLRGNYVDLNYSFNIVEFDSAGHPHQLDLSKSYHFGDKLYLTLKQKNGFYEPGILHDKLPQNTQSPVLKLTVESFNHYDNYGRDTLRGKSTYYFNFLAGIESYYTDPAEAKRLEKAILSAGADSTVVSTVLMVTEEGEARIKEMKVKVVER